MILLLSSLVTDMLRAELLIGNTSHQNQFVMIKSYALQQIMVETKMSGFD